ncbi:MAG: hypothetical protein RSJ41_00140 [Clostridia bacterium]
MEERLRDVIDGARELIREKRLNECEVLLSEAMFRCPHDATPHNLMGLLLEEKARHTDAMKHFRAACALDATYRPAAWNLEAFGAIYQARKAAYCEEDCEDHFAKAKDCAGNGAK